MEIQENGRVPAFLREWMKFQKRCGLGVRSFRRQMHRAAKTIFRTRKVKTGRCRDNGLISEFGCYHGKEEIYSVESIKVYGEDGGAEWRKSGIEWERGCCLAL